jgi:D-aminoacyl-tRNA deacylase
VRALLQRVSSAHVEVEGERVAEVSRGFLVLLGVSADDGPGEVEALAHKMSKLRVFEDGAGKMNLSLHDVGGEVLVVSQFTLYGDVKRGNRPSFIVAAPPERAEALYLSFTEHLKRLGHPVQTGVFGARMKVSLVNDGPVTLMLDSSKL